MDRLLADAVRAELATEKVSPIAKTAVRLA
jgi:hypothetical protein